MDSKDRHRAVSMAREVRARHFPAGFPPARHFAEGITSMGGVLTSTGNQRYDQPTLALDGKGHFVLNVPCDDARCFPRAVMGGARMLGYLFMDILGGVDGSLSGRKVSMTLPDDMPDGDTPAAAGVRGSVVFASELLLPESLVREAMSRTVEDTVWERGGFLWLRKKPVRRTRKIRRCVEHMAGSLGVSAVSTHIRIYGLGLKEEYMALPAW